MNAIFYFFSTKLFPFAFEKNFSCGLGIASCGGRSVTHVLDMKPLRRFEPFARVWLARLLAFSKADVEWGYNKSPEVLYYA